MTPHNTVPSSFVLESIGRIICTYYWSAWYSARLCSAWRYRAWRLRTTLSERLLEGPVKSE